MTRSLSIRPEVWEDVRDAVEWYEAARPGLGADLWVSVDGALSALASQPDFLVAPLFRIDEAHVVHRVRVPRFPFRVFFIESTEQRVVIAVLHNRRSMAVLANRASPSR